MYLRNKKKTEIFNQNYNVVKKKNHNNKKNKLIDSTREKTVVIERTTKNNIMKNTYISQMKIQPTFENICLCLLLRVYGINLKSLSFFVLFA